MKKHLFTALLCSVTVFVHAQYFIPPMDNAQVGLAKEVYTVTNAGDTIRGKVTSAMIITGQLRSFTIKQEDGTKSKFKSADVTILAVKPSKFTNIESAMSTPNLMKALDTDFDKVINREWVYFEQALLPKKKDKFVMMQLLNPGFDSKIKVYVDPNAKETMGVSTGGIKLVGGEDKSYLVVVNGEKSDVYKKSKYDKEALTELYVNCPKFEEVYDGKLEWRDFAEHVFAYDQLCQ